MAIKVFLLYNNHKGYTMIAVINLFRQLRDKCILRTWLKRGRGLILQKNLIELSAKGDVVAFETLIKAHQKKVYNIALRMTKDPEDAQELSQDACARIYCD